jgi:hypothetical protein
MEYFRLMADVKKSGVLWTDPSLKYASPMDLLHYRRLKLMTAFLIHLVQAAQRTRASILSKREIEEIDCIAPTRDEYESEQQQRQKALDERNLGGNNMFSKPLNWKRGSVEDNSDASVSLTIEWCSSTVASTKDGKIVVSVVPRLLFQLRRFYSLILHEIDYFTKLCDHIDSLSSA